MSTDEYENFMTRASTQVDRILEENIYRAFEKIAHKDCGGWAPSTIRRYLDRYWDLGDYWYEWYTADGIEESGWR